MLKRSVLGISATAALAAASLVSAGGADARVTRPAAAAPLDARCTGVRSTAVARDLMVPAGATCVITHGTTIGRDVLVGQGATLIDSAGVIGRDIVATNPKGIGVGGWLGQPGKVGRNILIDGTSGSGPGTVTGGDNYICHTEIGQNVTVENTVAGAGEWIVGDQDEECSGGGNIVGENLSVMGNDVRVDVADNREGSAPYAEGIDRDLLVAGNLVSATSPVVESNFVGLNATCQAGTLEDADGSPNIVQGTNTGCP